MANRSKLVTFRALPNPNFVRIDRAEGVVSGMESQSADTFLMLSEDLNRLTHTDVPEADHLIVRTGDDLRLVRLSQDSFNCILMAAQNMNLSFGSHIPNSHCRVSTT